MNTPLLIVSVQYHLSLSPHPSHSSLDIFGLASNCAAYIEAPTNLIHCNCSKLLLLQFHKIKLFLYEIEGSLANL